MNVHRSDRSTSTGGASGRRGRGERGSLIAETALISPFLVLLLLGIFEFGMVWRESVNNSTAARATARTVTNLGDQRSADWSGLAAFNAAMARKKNVTVNRVVIYKTTASDGSPTDPTCLTIVPAASIPVAGYGVSGACNIYNPAQLASLGGAYLTNFGPTDTACTGSAWDQKWCPVSRNADQSDPPDYVGVYINFTYKSWTGLLPTTVTMSERVVMRIEPKVS